MSVSKGKSRAPATLQQSLVSEEERNKDNFTPPAAAAREGIEPPTGTTGQRPPGGGTEFDEFLAEAKADAYEYYNGAEWFAKSKWGAFKRYIVNDGTKLLWMTIFVLGNIALFLERFFYYYKGPGAKLFPVYGFGIPIARGAATALKLNCAIILLPVCRNLMSWLRGTWVSNVYPFDKNIVFHKHIAAVIAFWAGSHIIAHMFNWSSIYNANIDTVNAITGQSFTTLPSPYTSAFLIVPGWTGQIIVIAMILMYSSSIEQMRYAFLSTLVIPARLGRIGAASA